MCILPIDGDDDNDDNDDNDDDNDKIKHTYEKRKSSIEFVTSK